MFKLVNSKPEIDPQFLFIPQFRNIWERDHSKTKQQANKELAFVYYMADYKSEYNAYGLSKEELIATDIMGDKDYHADDLIIEAIEKYEEMQDTISMAFLKANRKVAGSIIKFFEDQLYTPGKKGFTPAVLDKLMGAMSKFEKTMEALEKWEKKIQAEEESMQIRGGGHAGVFEDADKATWIHKK